MVNYPDNFERWGRILNPDAFFTSQSELNLKFAGPLGGAINADGSFYSNNQQIYDAQMNNILHNHKYQYVNGEFVGAVQTYGKYYGFDKNNNPITKLNSNTGEKIYGEFSMQVYTKKELFDAYGINEDWMQSGNGYGYYAKKHKEELLQIGKNFDDLANFSEKFVIGSGVAVGAILTAGVLAEVGAGTYITNAGTEISLISKDITSQGYAYINGSYNVFAKRAVQSLLKIIPSTSINHATVKKVVEYLNKNADKSRDIIEDAKKLYRLYKRFD